MECRGRAEEEEEAAAPPKAKIPAWKAGVLQAKKKPEEPKEAEKDPAHDKRESAVPEEAEEAASGEEDAQQMQVRLELQGRF